MPSKIFFIKAILFIVIVNATSHPKFRVIHGVDDEDNKYPYVVCLARLQSQVPGLVLYRGCTGTLIAPEWVLTAAHCLVPELQLDIVRYGNMSIPRNATDSTRRILKRMPHPNYKGALFIESIDLCKNDIGLVLVEEIQMMVLGKISSVDYRTLSGQKVTYAGYGRTGKRKKNKSLEIQESLVDEFKPLQLGKCMIRSCPQYLKFWSVLCAVPKCTSKGHRPSDRDSGGPLFLDDKVVAVLTGVKFLIIHDKLLYVLYTPVSPYLDWIRTTVNAHESAETRRVRRNNISRDPLVGDLESMRVL